MKKRITRKVNKKVTHKKSAKRPAGFFAALALIFLFAFLGAVFYWIVQPVTVELWGSSFEPVTLELENKLLDIKEKFGSRVNLKIHLVAQKENDQLVSFLLADERIGLPQFADSDLEENKRQLVIQKYFSNRYFDYLKARNSDYLSTPWLIAAQQAGISQNKLQKKLEGQGTALLEKESENLKMIRSQLDPRLDFIPLMFINKKLYLGRTDALSLSTAVAKPLIRQSRKFLPEPKTFSLFGNRLSFNLTPAYLANGVAETYSDSDCQDKKNKFGFAKDLGTKYARCGYLDPITVHLTVIAPPDYELKKDKVLFNLEQDFKGLISQKLAENSEEAEKLLDQTPKEIKEQGLSPVYVFSKDVENSYLFPVYQQNNLLIPLKESGYLLNQARLFGL